MFPPLPWRWALGSAGQRDRSGWQAGFFRGRLCEGITLVYFYPKAGTSGCTAEACSLRDSYDNYKRGDYNHRRKPRHAGRRSISGSEQAAVYPRGGYGRQVAEAFGVPMMMKGISPSPPVNCSSSKTAKSPGPRSKPRQGQRRGSPKALDGLK